MEKINKAVFVGLILVVIVIILVFFEKPEEDDLFFDTAYVLNLLDEKEDLSSQVLQLNQQNKQQQDQLAELKQAVSELSTSRPAVCEEPTPIEGAVGKEDYQLLKNELSEVNVKYLECSLENRQAKIDVYQTQDLHRELINTKNAHKTQQTLITSLKQQVSQLELDKKKADNIVLALQTQITKLNEDILMPLYLKDIQIDPVYCAQNPSSTLLCLQQIVVLAEFSKKPSTDVVVKFISEQNAILAEWAYDATKRSRLEFVFEEDEFLTTGAYKITFTIGEHVISEKTFNISVDQYKTLEATSAE